MGLGACLVSERVPSGGVWRVVVVLGCLWAWAVPCAAQGAPRDPLLFAGVNYDHGGRAHAAAEVWFSRLYADRHAWATELLAGIKPDGTVKIGTGFALFTGEDAGAFIFVDGRAWGYAEGSAGGTGGGGVDGGVGMAIERVLVRVGYGYAGIMARDGRPSVHPGQRGVTAAVSVRVWP